MNIVHLVYSGIGGAGNICLSLFKEDLKYKKYSSHIIFTGPQFSKIYKKKNINNRFSFIKTIKYFQFLSWFAIIFKLIKIKPDVIYLHNYQIVPSIVYCFIFKKKIIYIDHGALNYKRSRYKLIIQLIKIFRINTVVLNKENFDYFLKNNINKKKIHLIPNGVNHNFFKKNKKKKKKFFILGMAGRLDYFKRQEILIKVLSNQRISKLDLKLSFAGDGPKFKLLSKLAKKYNVENKLIFNGFLNDKKLKKWFNNLDLYVHASSGEGMSTAILQAMSMEIPIIASNVYGIKNIFKIYPKIGDLFNNNNYDEISKLIYSYYSNKSKLKKQISRKYILKYFTVKKMHKRYINLAESII